MTPAATCATAGTVAQTRQTAESISVPAHNAASIAEALVRYVLREHGPGLRRLAREIVVPITSERADIVAIEDRIWLFEIKSGRDSLRRLERQAEAFGRVGERCVLVVASRHLARARELVPRWWGIIEVPDGPAVTLRWDQAAEPNPRTDRRTLLLMLRRDEAEAALTALAGNCVSGRRRMALLARLDRLLDDEALARCVRDALVRRD